MDKKSRTYSSTLNILIGLINQSLVLLCTFITRIVFVKTLGESFLGIEGLFSNILTILSLADLGFGNAIIYSMYKPLAENDKDKICALMNFYKNIYNVIGLAIAIIGISLLPFLDFLINLETPIENIKLYYLLFLANTVVSYLLASRSSIIIADQKMYITKIYSVICEIIKTIAQIYILIVHKNFILYLIIQILCTFLKNLFSAFKADKMYPYIKEKKILDKKEKKNLFENVKSMFIYRIMGVIVTNTDNIIISILVGTVSVGYYSNYLLIINGVITFTNIIFQSITSSIGNLSITETAEKKKEIFDVINFIASWLFGFCSICFIILFEDFITLSYGEQYVLSTSIEVAIVLNFYSAQILRPISTYRDSIGMFNKTKYIAVITVILNIIFSIILGKLYGIFGIIIATVIARILTNMWYEPYVLYKDYFKSNVITYYKNIIAKTIINVIICCITYIICCFIKETTIDTFIIKIIICIIVPNILMLIIYKENNEMKIIKEKIFIPIKDKILKFKGGKNGI